MEDIRLAHRALTDGGRLCGLRLLLTVVVAMAIVPAALLAIVAAVLLMEPLP